MAVFVHSFTLETGRLVFDEQGLDAVVDPTLRVPLVKTTYLGTPASDDEYGMLIGGHITDYSDSGEDEAPIKLEDGNVLKGWEIGGAVRFGARPNYNGRKLIIPGYGIMPHGMMDIGTNHGRIVFSEQLPLDASYIHTDGNSQTTLWSAKKVLADERVSGIEQIVTEPGSVVKFGFPDDHSEDADRWLLLGGMRLPEMRNAKLYDVFPTGWAFYVRVLRTP